MSYGEKSEHAKCHSTIKNFLFSVSKYHFRIKIFLLSILKCHSTIKTFLLSKSKSHSTIKTFFRVSSDFSFPNFRSFPGFPGPPRQFFQVIRNKKKLYVQSFYTLLLANIKIFFKIFYCGKNYSTKNYSGTKGGQSLEHCTTVVYMSIANDQIKIKTKGKKS